MIKLFQEAAISKEYFHIWKYLSMQDVKSRFRHSKLGFMWIIIQQLTFAFGGAFIWARIFHLSPNDFIPFLTLGFTLWNFLSLAIMEGCNIFVISHSYLKQLPLPQSIFIFKTLLTQCFYLSIGLFTSISIMAAFGKFNMLGILLSLPGILIIILYAYGMLGTMAYLGLRYRDLPHALTGILTLLMVLTPIIYPPEILIQKGLSYAIYLNPFAALVEIVRYPLLDGQFAAITHYIVASLFAATFVTLRFCLAHKWGRFVPFWA